MNKFIPTFEEYSNKLNEGFIEDSLGKGNAAAFITSDNIDKEKEIKQFIEYWDLSPTINDIVNFIKKSLDKTAIRKIYVYNDKSAIISLHTFDLSTNNTIEINISKSKINLKLLELVRMHWKLIKTVKFSYKELKNLFKNN